MISQLYFYLLAVTNQKIRLREFPADLEKQIERAATDFVKLNQLSKEKEEQEALLEEKMERYLYLSDLADRIAAQ